MHHETGIPPHLVRPELVAAMKQEAHDLFPSVFATIIARMEGMFVQAIYDLESDLMGRGRIAIIGDGAFVARPHCGAGVSKAADDAASLVDALSTNKRIARRHRRLFGRADKGGISGSQMGRASWIIFPDGPYRPSAGRLQSRSAADHAASTYSATGIELSEVSGIRQAPTEPPEYLLRPQRCYPAISRKDSHSVGSCFNAAGQPPCLLPSAGLTRRPQNANSAPVAENGNGDS